jgi:hypothetical protein
MGGGWPTPRQTVWAGTKACVCAETGVKMQSWLNLMQLEQRPSSVASKPEHRIYGESKLYYVSMHCLAVKYLAASAVPAGNGSALAGSWRLVVLLDILRWWRRLLSIWVWRRRSTRPFIGAWQTVRLRVLVLVLRMLGHVGSRLLGRRRRERGVHLV